MKYGVRRPVVWTVIVLLAAESALAVVVTVLLVAELSSGTATDSVSAIALIVLAALAAVWAAAMVVAAWRGRAWVRGSALAWQLLQLAVGISALTGVGPQPGLAWPLILVAAVTIILLLTPAVRAHLSLRGDQIARSDQPEEHA